jgi:hypothetical protein
MSKTNFPYKSLGEFIINKSGLNLTEIMTITKIPMSVLESHFVHHKEIKDQYIVLYAKLLKLPSHSLIEKQKMIIKYGKIQETV